VYFKIPLPSSVRYEGEWFYVWNTAGSAPRFTGREPVSTDNGVEPSLKDEVEALLSALEMLKRQGLTGARLVRNFMHRRIQPLKARQRPMHRYSGVNDPDRHSFEPLALSEIEARVKVVTALSSGSFMDEDSPHPLSGKVSSDLVSSLSPALLVPLSSSVSNVRSWPLQGNGPLAPSLPPLPEVLAVQAERKHKRSDGETLGARMKRLRAQKKGKRVMRPSKSSEGATFSSDSNDASSTASSWEDLAALTGGPMCRGDAVASSNVPVEAGGPAADPPLVAASSADGAGVAAASEVAQLFTGAGGITEGGATHPAALEAASWATPRSFVPSLVAQGKVVTRKRSSRYVDSLVFLFLAFTRCLMFFFRPARTCRISP
jgi:hypothetical protein